MASIQILSTIIYLIIGITSLAFEFSCIHRHINQLDSRLHITKHYEAG